MLLKKLVKQLLNYIKNVILYKFLGARLNEFDNRIVTWYVLQLE